MSISIQTNENSLVAQENLRVNSVFQSVTITRLTSGYRINSSGDDAAGLAVANKYRSDIAELTQGVRNANDGISALQIVDGGLSNISKMMDRMKTLATQAASSTFTGNRNTLDNEFQALKTEINRQAANIGLVNGGANNTSMEVYIGGGGANQSNSKVTVDLSGTGNQVDSTNLGIGGASLLSGGTALGALNVKGLTDRLSALGATQNFTFHLGPGSDKTVTVTGAAGGITTDNAVSQLNAALGSTGIAAYVDSTTGILSFSGSVAFTVAAGAASTGAGTGIATNAAAADNTSQYRVTNTEATMTAVGAGHTEQLDFVKDGVTTTVTLTDVTGANTTAALAALSTGLRGTGITALLNNAGTGITFQAASTFTIARTGTAAEGIFALDQAATAATAPAAGSSATANALSAINVLTTAVSTLGSVQGRVGTGQNKLASAISLAQSQITSFSAAESRVRDADVASEAANLTKAQVLQQASMAAMAQANSAPQAVLSLLRG
jgi:flagellin